MKNITLSAREESIYKARSVAAKQHRTLNELFRLWLDELGSQQKSSDIAADLKSLWSQTNYVRVGKHLTRAERNER